jgi:hypothetical protein
VTQHYKLVALPPFFKSKITPMSESMQKLIKDKKMWAHEMIPIIAKRCQGRAQYYLVF